MGGRAVCVVIFNDIAKQFTVVLLCILFGVAVLFVIAGWVYTIIDVSV